MDLLHKAATRPRLRSAWSKIRHRPDSKGFDGQTIEIFEQNLNQNLEIIRRELLSKTYKFTLLRGSALTQSLGSPRPLKIPAVRDRVVQKALELILTPFLKKAYRIENTSSFAYIKGCSVKDAAEKVRELYKEGNEWVYEADIVKFFNNVDRSKLLNDFIFPALPDDSLNTLITEAINAEIGNGPELERLGYLKFFPEATEGIPQGGILSPLFANVYLSPLDTAMIDGGYNLVRYADDFIVMCKSEKEAKDADTLARNIVEKQLGLSIYPLIPKNPTDKHSRICRLHNIEFLGLNFQGKNISPGTKAVKKIIQTIKDTPTEYRSTDLSRALYAIRSRILTWGATYYYTTIPKEIERSLNEHLITATRKLLENFGLRSQTKRFQLKHMTRVGIPSFSDAIKRAASKTHSQD